MARSRKIKAGDARRAKVILRLAKGESYQRIILLEECGSEFITRWRKRFEAERLGGLYARHRGRIISDKVLSQEAKILSATQQAPVDGSTHWTTRKLARHLSVSHSRVARVWARAGIQPHRLRRYMASKDPEFEEKALDIIGLYQKPPLHAAVFCVDEKERYPGTEPLGSCTADAIWTARSCVTSAPIIKVLPQYNGPTRTLSNRIKPTSKTNDTLHW